MEKTATTEIPGDAEEWVLTGFAFLLPSFVLALLSLPLGGIAWIMGFLSGIFLTIGYFKFRGR